MLYYPRHTVVDVDKWSWQYCHESKPKKTQVEKIFFVEKGMTTIFTTTSYAEATRANRVDDIEETSTGPR